MKSSTFITVFFLLCGLTLAIVIPLAIKYERQQKINKEQFIAKEFLTCPFCGAYHNYEYHEDNFSLGTAIGGGLFFGAPGLLLGFATNKDKYTCNSCGHTFTKQHARRIELQNYHK